MCPNGGNKRLEQHVEFITFALNFKTICSFVFPCFSGDFLKNSSTCKISLYIKEISPLSSQKCFKYFSPVGWLSFYFAMKFFCIELSENTHENNFPGTNHYKVKVL